MALRQLNSPTALFYWCKVWKDLWNSMELLAWDQPSFSVACVKVWMSACTCLMNLFSSKFANCETMYQYLIGLLNAFECCDQQNGIVMPHGWSLSIKKIRQLPPSQGVVFIIEMVLHFCIITTINVSQLKKWALKNN